MPKPLDRQLAEERARHPTPREAARAGVGFGLLIWAAGVALELAERFVPGDMHPPPPVGWPRELVGLALGLAGALLVSVLLCELGAALVRWRRRLAARVWHPDRAV